MLPELVLQVEHKLAGTGRPIDVEMNNKYTLLLTLIHILAFSTLKPSLLGYWLRPVDKRRAYMPVLP